VYQEGIEARLSQHETVVRSLENECLRLNRENKTLKSLLATAISLRPEQRKVTKV
jgi:exonuclease VII small subunit